MDGFKEWLIANEEDIARKNFGKEYNDLDEKELHKLGDVAAKEYVDYYSGYIDHIWESERDTLMQDAACEAELERRLENGRELV